MSIATPAIASPRRASAAARRRRLTELRGAGLVDSAGLALGWSVFTLHAAHVQGLAAVGVYHAAMYVGVALASPFTGWITRRADGRAILRTLALLEAALRVASFGFLIVGVPWHAVAATVLLQNVVAWTGYAVMRAEVAAVDARAANLTWYGVCIGATEALAAATAVFLPTTSLTANPLVLVGVALAYAGCLIPTWRVAANARTTRRSVSPQRAAIRLPIRALGGGGMVMLLGAGPTLLALPLAQQLAGRAGVVVAAVAFMVGCLAAPAVAGTLDRAAPRHAWPLLGGGMVLGFALAPVHVLGLGVAQLLAGVAFTALEGSMDARLLAEGESGSRVLAYGASVRALGGAGAVVTLPMLLTVGSMTQIALSLAGLLGVCWLVAGYLRAQPAPPSRGLH